MLQPVDDSTNGNPLLELGNTVLTAFIAGKAARQDIAVCGSQALTRGKGKKQVSFIEFQDGSKWRIVPERVLKLEEHEQQLWDQLKEHEGEHDDEEPDEE